jgi:hypothetical protein
MSDEPLSLDDATPEPLPKRKKRPAELPYEVVDDNESKPVRKKKKRSVVEEEEPKPFSVAPYFWGVVVRLGILMLMLGLLILAINPSSCFGNRVVIIKP